MSEWMSVKLRDIFSVEIEESTKEVSASCCLPFANNANSSSSSQQALMVCYAQRRRNSDIWECEGVRLLHAEVSVLNEWHATIQSALNGKCIYCASHVFNSGQPIQIFLYSMKLIIVFPYFNSF